jgi:hypothetical protein
MSKINEFMSAGKVSVFKIRREVIKNDLKLGRTKFISEDRQKNIKNIFWPDEKSGKRYSNRPT